MQGKVMHTPLALPPLGRCLYNLIMPHRKRRPTVEQLSDITGALKTQRWNYCQAIARGFYLSALTPDQLRSVLQSTPAKLLQLLKS